MNKYVIVNLEDNRFLGRLGEWRDSYTEAKHFTTREEAVIFSWTVKGKVRVMSLEMVRQLQKGL